MNAPAENAASQQVKAVPTAAAADQQSREAWRSEELLGQRMEVQILHNGEVYRLRRTRHGKLILYK